MVFVTTSSPIKLSSMMSQSYFTIKVAHVHENITLVSTLVQEIRFFRTTYNVQIKAEHLNFQFSHVTKFITKVIHWMSFIIVINFLKICANISFVVNEGSIYFHGAHHNMFPLYSNVSVLRNFQQRAARF